MAVVVALKLNGYMALAYDWQSRHQPGNHYVLRVSDITTLLSAATTVIGFFGKMWIGIITWRYIFILLQNDGMKIHHISQMIGGLPPWKWPQRIEWPVFIILLCIFPQQYVDPLFSGSVNWNFANQFGPPFHMDSGSPTASSSLWYWYLQQASDRLRVSRQAEGLASISWTANDGQTAVDGTDGIFGGVSCRHVMSGVAAVNSTVQSAVIPCIEIHNITWPNEKVPDDIQGFAGGNNHELSIVGGIPFSDYEHSGAAVMFSRKEPQWNTASTVSLDHDNAMATFPEATRYSGNMTVIVLLLRQDANGCRPVAGSSLGNHNVFGNTGDINQQLGDNPFPSWANTQEDCFVYGTVYFTAGIVRPRSSTFVSSQVVEFYPNLDYDAEENTLSSSIQNITAIIEPSIWTREALWLMPDVMSSLAVMNSSLLPTWENLNNYTATLIRQSYFASWDVLHLAFEQNDTGTLNVFPAENRLQASVSFARLFAWLGITFLVPVTGFIFGYLQNRYSQRSIIIDPIAVLLTDPSGIVASYPEVSALSSVTEEDRKMGRLIMKQIQPEKAQFQLILQSERVTNP